MTVMRVAAGHLAHQPALADSQGLADDRQPLPGASRHAGGAGGSRHQGQRRRSRPPLGRYTYDKILKDGTVIPCSVKVFGMEVRRGTGRMAGNGPARAPLVHSGRSRRCRHRRRPCRIPALGANCRSARLRAAARSWPEAQPATSASSRRPGPRPTTRLRPVSLGGVKRAVGRLQQPGFRISPAFGAGKGGDPDTDRHLAPGQVFDMGNGQPLDIGADAVLPAPWRRMASVLGSSITISSPPNRAAISAGRCASPDIASQMARRQVSPAIWP